MRYILFSFFLIVLTIKIDLTNGLPIFGEIYIEKDKPKNQLAAQYCDSIEKNLFTGLDKESILKYEYFFSSIPDDFIKDENQFLEIFKTDVKSICSYEITNSYEKELKSFLRNYFKTSRSTPKIKVEAINPTLTNPAIIPVLR